MCLYNPSSDSAHQDRVPSFLGFHVGAAILNLKTVGIVVVAAHCNENSHWLLTHIFNAAHAAAISAIRLNLLSEFNHSRLDQLHGYNEGKGHTTVI